MKVYISGPITGTTDYMERFQAAEEKLKEEGHAVINPARVNAALPQDTTWEEYMEMSYTMMNMADAIYMLSGWGQSEGSKAEFNRAINRQMTIIFEGGK